MSNYSSIHLSRDFWNCMLPSTFEVFSLLILWYSLLDPQTKIRYSDTHYKTTFPTFIKSTKIGIIYMPWHFTFPWLQIRKWNWVIRILKPGMYLRSQLLQLTPRYFTTEREPESTMIPSPEFFSLHPYDLGLPPTHTNSNSSCELQYLRFSKNLKGL